jgi:hypothetical protein
MNIDLTRQTYAVPFYPRPVFLGGPWLPLFEVLG